VVKSFRPYRPWGAETPVQRRMPPIRVVYAPVKRTAKGVEVKLVTALGVEIKIVMSEHAADDLARTIILSRATSKHFFAT